MSPNPAPPMIDDSNPTSAAPGREREVQEPAVVGNTQSHERGAGIDDRVLTMHQALADRMQALEMSQMDVNEDERLRGAIDAGFYASELGRGMGGASMHRVHLATTRRNQHAGECAWRNQDARFSSRSGRSEAADNSKHGNKRLSKRRLLLVSMST